MKKVIDFNGITHDSISDMCDYYGISMAVYRWRIQNGWEQREALTIAVNSRSKLDTICSRIKELKLQRHSSTIYKKIRYGMSFEEAVKEYL